jgi:hypothetical protein
MLPSPEPPDTDASISLAGPAGAALLLELFGLLEFTVALLPVPLDPASSPHAKAPSATIVARATSLSVFCMVFLLVVSVFPLWGVPKDGEEVACIQVVCFF